MCISEEDVSCSLVFIFVMSNMYMYLRRVSRSHLNATLFINGHKLDNLLHSAAVELFRSAGENVELRVQQGHTMPLVNGPSRSRPDNDPSYSALRLLGITLASVVLLTVIYMRLRPKRHF